MIVEKISKYLSAKYFNFNFNFIVTNLKILVQRRDANFFYGLIDFHFFIFPRYISIFQKWTKINVQK